MLRNKQWVVLTLSAITGLSFILVPIVALGIKSNTETELTISIPEHWPEYYVEDYDVYNSFDVFGYTEWSTIVPTDSEDFITVDEDYELTEAVFVFKADNDSAISSEDRRIALLTEAEAWDYISNGIWTDYPKGSFNANKDKLLELQDSNTEVITVKVWSWANNNEHDLSKITEELTVAVNAKLAKTFKHIFQDIYNHTDKPVVNVNDKAMGTWVLRGKNHNNSNTMSAHALGAAIDINPSTGSVYVNNIWYGNAYGQKMLPTDMWYQLPDTQVKYNILYENSPIVEIFKSYGFYWGGDWNSGTDCMHLSYIGDGSEARVTGISNFKERN